MSLKSLTVRESPVWRAEQLRGKERNGRGPLVVKLCSQSALGRAFHHDAYNLPLDLKLLLRLIDSLDKKISMI